MHIPSNKILKSNAVSRLNASQSHTQVVLIYAGITAAAAALVTIINYCLGLQINQMGGLSNMGAKSVLTTIQTVLPMILSFALLCLDIGYLSAMLRVTRSQHTSPQALRLGFDRFGVLLRATIFRFFIYMGVAFVAFWISSQIYLFTPFSQPVYDIIAPFAAESTTNMDFLLDEAIANSLIEAMIPLYLMFGAVYLAFVMPISYSFRMVNYLIIDKPGMGALAVMAASRTMMRGKRMRLFKLDLSLWWWFVLSALVSVLAYGDSLLPMLGIALPFSETVAFFLFYFLFLGAQFALTCFLRSRVEVIYAQVYEKLRPREDNQGVVLGNIFQM